MYNYTLIGTGDLLSVYREQWEQKPIHITTLYPSTHSFTHTTCLVEAFKTKEHV